MTSTPLTADFGRASSCCRAASAASTRSLTSLNCLPTKGRWSVKPDSAKYRWFAGKKKIKGKAGKKRAYVVQPGDEGTKLRVRVTVKADGYAKASAKSKPKKVKK